MRILLVSPPLPEGSAFCLNRQRLLSRLKAASVEVVESKTTFPNPWTDQPDVAYLCNPNLDHDYKTPSLMLEMERQRLSHCGVLFNLVRHGRKLPVGACLFYQFMANDSSIPAAYVLPEDRALLRGMFPRAFRGVHITSEPETYITWRRNYAS